MDGLRVILEKHSRAPRKNTPIPRPEKQFSVTKRPMYAIPEDKRTEIAHDVLNRYILGEQVSKIAPDYKTSDVTIYALLLREHQDAWVDIQQARAVARLELYQDELREIKEKMKVAPDTLSLARLRDEGRMAESLVKSAQWELERLLKRLYGHETNVNINLTDDRGDRLRRARERVIESEHVAIAQHRTAQSPNNGEKDSQEAVSA